jgi:hypothetical protein
VGGSCSACVTCETDCRCSSGTLTAC